MQNRIEMCGWWCRVIDLPSLQVKKEAVDEVDMFDELVAANTGKSLAARLGNSPDMIAKKVKSKKVAGEKQDKTKKVCVLVSGWY